MKEGDALALSKVTGIMCDCVVGYVKRHVA